MSKRSAYLDQTEFIKVLNLKDRRLLVKELGVLAEGGNIQAADLYGDFLIQGVWDEERMIFDLVSDKLLPNPPDPKKDPYLILSRDVQKAITFYHFATNNSELEQIPAFKMAKAKLEYCHRMGLAGFIANSLIPLSADIDMRTKNFLIKYAKNTLSDSSGQFLSLPDRRPDIKNPLTELFSRLGIIQRDRTIIQISITVFLVALIKFFIVDFRIYISFICCFLLPLIGCALVYHKFGFIAKMPMCSCASIKLAYSEELEKLPETCRNKADPFKTHNIIIRNFTVLKRIWLWFTIVSFLIHLAFLSDTALSPKQRIDLLMNDTLTVFLSLCFIGWEMNLSKFLKEIRKARNIASIFIGLCNYCCNELESSKTSYDFKSVIEKKIEDATIFIPENL